MSSIDLTREFLAQRDQLYALVCVLIGDSQQAEDIFQDVGVAILQHARQGTEVVDFLPWARSICRRRCVDHIRSVSRSRSRLQHLDHYAELVDRAFEENPLEANDLAAMQTALQQCMQKLSRRAQQLIVGFYHHERSITQLADECAWTPAAIKVALSRARGSLSACVGRRWKPGA